MIKDKKVHKNVRKVVTEEHIKGLQKHAPYFYYA